jgi:ABC-type Fe3+/spermidine/putrescine transport system ATPase subunit
LRIIAGLEPVEGGRICWNGSDITTVPVHRRNFGLMFQDYALFPHRDVAENVAFGLRMQRLPRQEIETRVQAALEQVNLAAFAHRRVTDLSGGEQQRVALARALAPRPRLLMLDEPLGALDRALREQLLRDLRLLLHQTGIPAIYVTHDQEEAFSLADRMVLLHEGRVEQDGSPSSVYAHPASPWAARFLGMGNLVPGRVRGVDPLEVETPLGIFPANSDLGHPPRVSEPVYLLLRPDAAQVDPPGSPIHGTVADVLFRGEGYRVELDCAQGIRLHFWLAQAPAPGAELTLYLPPEALECLAETPE